MTPPPDDGKPDPRAAAPTSARRRTMNFADQELRLISALVLLMALGLLLALPFVLSIGAVVFLPLVTAIILTILLSPLADRLASWGLPNFLASLASLLALIGVVALALTAVLRPAVSLYDEAPAMIARVGEHFSQIKGSLQWLTRLNRQVAEIIGSTGEREVVLAGPSMLEQLAFATPTVLVEVLLTIMLSFFMIEARVRMRRRLLLQRSQVDASLRAARVMREVQDRVAAYILTVGVINLGVGLIVGLGAWAMGLDAPVMWGGLAALLNFLPYVGPMIMVSMVALFGLGTADQPLIGLMPAAFYLALHTVESNIVTPAVLGARFTMNPVMILLALTALIDHLGRPNLVGFLFGEPLFAANVLELSGED